MLQLLKEKPTYLSGELGPLEQEWKRFADGAVLFEQLEPALRAHFVCTAETVMQDADAEEKEPSGLEKLTQFLPTGRGTLYILAGTLIWAQDGEGPCWMVDYRNVMLHAVSRPDTRPSLYLQIEVDSVDFSGLSGDGEEEVAFRGEDKPFLEVNLFLENEGQLDEAFIALSECAALHPDSDESSEDDDESAKDEDDHDIEIEGAEDEDEHNSAEDESTKDTEPGQDQKRAKTEKKIEQFEDEAGDLLR